VIRSAGAAQPPLCAIEQRDMKRDDPAVSEIDLEPLVR
jgi:hypothetical protein